MFDLYITLTLQLLYSVKLPARPLLIYNKLVLEIPNI